jgi:UDP-N-acetylmuramyl pentapeptide phosphotransferase/UDP-N-acetylglucosamine-1-phosphate transferase
VSLAACFTSAVIAGFVRRLAWRLRLIDVPNERSSHHAPTPRGGGIGIVIGCLAPLLILRFHETWPCGFPAIGVGALVIAGVSLADDLWSLSAKLRLTVHLSVAFAVVLALNVCEPMQLPAGLSMPAAFAVVPLAVVWMVISINAYNFMDGIDGLAGVQAVVAGTAWGIAGLMGHSTFIAACGFMIAGAALGFLVHNWPPARLFMGDVGSAFLGYSFAVLPLIEHPRRVGFIVAGIFFIWPFLFDVSVTLVRRFARGEPLLMAHRSHLYQRLVARGVPHSTVLGAYAALAIAGAAAGLAYVAGARAMSFGTVAVIVVAAASLWWRVERAPGPAVSGTGK